MTGDITVMVLTWNEAANIGRTLGALRWAARVLIVDSGSTDGTLEVARAFLNVEIVQRPFDDFATQRNFGLASITTDWVLSLDADYEPSPALANEIASLRRDGLWGFEARFIYRIGGHALRASLYPPRVVLYRREGARYRNEGHGHRLVAAGPVGRLAAPIWHDDRKPLSRWLASQQRYARVEAAHLLAMPHATLSVADRLRLMAWPAPLLVFLYTFFAKGCLLDGWAGWTYVLQRTLAEMLLALELTEQRQLRLGAAGDGAHLHYAPHREKPDGGAKA